MKSLRRTALSAGAVAAFAIATIGLAAPSASAATATAALSIVGTPGACPAGQVGLIVSGNAGPAAPLDTVTLDVWGSDTFFDDHLWGPVTDHRVRGASSYQEGCASPPASSTRTTARTRSTSASGSWVTAGRFRCARTRSATRSDPGRRPARRPDAILTARCPFAGQDGLRCTPVRRRGTPGGPFVTEPGGRRRPAAGRRRSTVRQVPGGAVLPGADLQLKRPGGSGDSPL